MFIGDRASDYIAQRQLTLRKSVIYQTLGKGSVSEYDEC